MKFRLLSPLSARFGDSLGVAMRLLTVVVAVMSASVALTSCGGDDDNPDDEITAPGGGEDVPGAEGTPRTVLVYMVANNSLGTSYHCDEADFQEMLTAASTTGFHGGRLLVYHNPPRCSASNHCVLIEVTSNELKTLKSYPYGEPGESTTPERMREVMADMKAYAPADDYGLVLWSHADNWFGAKNSTDNRYRGFGQDDDYRMSLPTLAATLKDERFAFLYFDCCLMGNVEPLYELRHLAPLAVASPTELGIDGMPYHWNAPVMFDPSLSDKEKCVKMAENSYNYYMDHSNQCTGSYSCQRTSECQMTVVSLDELDALAEATREIFAKVTRLPVSLNSLQSYNTRWDNWGAYDMDSYMELLVPAADTDGLLAAWRAQLERTVLSKPYSVSAIGDVKILRYCGLGSYAMTNVSQRTWRGYDTLQWWSDVVSASPLFANIE